MPTAVSDPAPVEFLKLVAEPIRWQLLRRLADSDQRVGDLTERIARGQNLVSYHLGELRTAGLVTARRSSADRRDTYYRVDLDRFGALLRASAGELHPALHVAPEAALHPAELPQTWRRTPRVLFLCTGNSARSQIAEALLEHRSGGAITAESAGSKPKPLHPLAVQVLAERGLDIAGHESKHLSRFEHERFDRVVTLCDKVKEVCPEFPGAPPAAHWSMADPSAEGDSDEDSYRVFVRTAEEIDTRVGHLIARLADEERNRHGHD